MNNTNQQIAEQFSAGKFHVIYPVISPDIAWQMVGEPTATTGKDAVIEFCERMSAEANQTSFTNTNTIIQGDYVVVEGYCTYTVDGKEGRVNYCDVFLFEGSLLKTITSYAIELKR